MESTSNLSDKNQRHHKESKYCERLGPLQCSHYIHVKKRLMSINYYKFNITMELWLNSVFQLITKPFVWSITMLLSAVRLSHAYMRIKTVPFRQKQRSSLLQPCHEPYISILFLNVAFTHRFESKTYRISLGVWFEY